MERFDASFDPFRQSSPAAAPISINNNSFGLGTGQMAVLSKSPTPADIGAKEAKNVEIAEVIVGAILGKKPSFSTTLSQKFFFLLLTPYIQKI